MDIPNLMFRNDNNYLNWKNSPYDWQECGDDLNLSDILQSLKSISFDFPAEYLHTPCIDAADAGYRLDIMEELYLSFGLLSSLSDFNISLRHFGGKIKEYRKTEDKVQKSYRFLSLFLEYGAMIKELNAILSSCRSEGLLRLFDYTNSVMEKYAQLFEYAKKLEDEISTIYNGITLSVNPDDRKVKIIRKGAEKDIMEQLADSVYEYFGISIKCSFSFVDPNQLSVLEKTLLDILQSQNEDTFETLQRFNTETPELIDVISDFSMLYHQLEYYLTYVKLLSKIKDGCISVCKPIFNEKEFYACECACPSLVTKFIGNDIALSDIVCNDICIKKGGMFLLSGPNQGGKTMYLKALGLTAYLAKCGCLVFCKSCSLPFYDVIFTHFMKPEVLGRGRLIEEVERMENIVTSATGNSIILMNESFASTRRKDGTEIAVYYLRKLKEKNCCVGFVSHYYEIPETMNTENIIIESLKTGISDDGKRTYKVYKSIGKGWAYAKDIAIKCGMTYEQILSVLEVR
ncbi:MAG: hypothetical protein IKQ18_01200 [Clostridia bacterium]|nr:hypothetical protein [Clostridia bacterium]